MHKLKEVIISITNRCNSSCRMCDIPKEKLGELSFFEWEKVIKDISLLGASTVVFSGGEPLLRKDIFKLIYFVKKNHMNACVASNGILVSEENAAKLSSSGVDIVNISLEGPEEIHNYLRGDGAFEKAIAALDNLRKYNVESTVATMVSRYNYKHLTHIAKTAAKYGATAIKLQPFNSIFIKDKTQEANFLISKEEAVELSQIIKQMQELCNKYGISINPYVYLKKMPSYLSRELFNSNGGCKALWTSCPINSKGEIYPCWVLADRNNLIGSVKEKRFRELWGSQRQNLIRDKIKKDGCYGCMMSCYDENFGRDSFKKRIPINTGRLKKEGIVRYIDRIFRQWQRRARFYFSYRGPPCALMKRSNAFFMKKKSHIPSEDKIHIQGALQDIDRVKQMLEEQISLLR